MSRNSHTSFVNCPQMEYCSLRATRSSLNANIKAFTKSSCSIPISAESRLDQYGIGSTCKSMGWQCERGHGQLVFRLHTPDTVSWFCCGFSSVKHAYSTCRRGSGQTADRLLPAITKLTHNHLFLTIPLSRCIPLRSPCINAHDGVYHMSTSCVCTKQLRLSTELIEAQLPPLSAILRTLRINCICLCCGIYFDVGETGYGCHTFYITDVFRNIVIIADIRLMLCLNIVSCAHINMQFVIFTS